jgi:hypothetical protein
MSASSIQFVSTNLTNRFEQMGVNSCALKRSDGSRRKRRITLPRNGTKSVHPLELTARKIRGVRVARHVLGRADQAGSVGATTGSDNGEAGGAESI